ncbi:DUF262 domain-containing protein [Nocardioides sp. URHA0032]|uniref:DUF262 domain-containing protein n=1 Tax=Nocardioides sp. URHA0032 TaxID=1380388 RepID=UPI00048B97DF|nr:DUF262 domain-containing protein [Nocardioides sp. URHA0032]
MKGFATTYSGIFDSARDERPAVHSIEIPIIQRDYAQGREDSDTITIRREFLDVLIRALTTADSVGLDFIYGEVADGVLKPLDGQQRLTTMFLLHWYVASRAGTLDASAPWSEFRYATRLSAEYFCRELVSHTWPANDADPVDWITDQAWYLFPWRTDPTIQSMLVMIGAIHDRLSSGDHDFDALWERLTSPDDAAISFLFLPIDDMESGDDLYIKMNSRGKPLTEFEVFKARLEKLLGSTGRQTELSEKLDREWSDLLWHYEGGNFLVDEEFMNYFTFIVDVCEWRTGSTRTPDRLLERAQRVFVDHEDAQTHLEFLFFAFDTWVGARPSDNVPAEVLTDLFRVDSNAESGLLLFESQDSNLFAACLEHYGTKQFSLAETIFLFAVIIFRQTFPDGEREDLNQRLRSLRNIAESAPDDVRSEYMPELIASTTKLMTDPADSYLDGLKRFNQARIDDERLKRDLLAAHPELQESVCALEDHELLRGRLFAFDLDTATLDARGETFRAVTTVEALPHLASALLTKGDYSRSLGARRQFGVPGQRRGGGSWRDVLTGGSRDGREAMRDAVDRLLEDVAGRNEPVADALEAIVSEWLTEQEASGRYDWRYYFVRYPSMLSAPQGIYVGEYDSDGVGYGYRVDMLKGGDYRAAFTDPFLLAVWDELGQPQWLTKPEFRSWDYTGTEKAMKLSESGTGIRSQDAGFEIALPDDATQTALVHAALVPFGIDSDNIVRVSPKDRHAESLDSEDRVQVGIQLARALLKAGL